MKEITEYSVVKYKLFVHFVYMAIIFLSVVRTCKYAGDTSQFPRSAGLIIKAVHIGEIQLFTLRSFTSKYFSFTQRRGPGGAEISGGPNCDIHLLLVGSTCVLLLNDVYLIATRMWLWFCLPHQGLSASAYIDGRRKS